MARKIGNRHEKNAAAAAKAEAAAGDVDVLHPERILNLSGRVVTMREYGHVEWLRLLPRAAPLVETLSSYLEGGRPPSYEEALDVMTRHVDELMPLVMQACDLPADIVLRPDDGELLLMAWWGCNGRFFVQRALNRLMVRAQEERVVAAQATPRSTSPSSPSPASHAPTSKPAPSAS
ncbi:DUF6631 family protein [Caldimonas sp. KR1-144]|uniref:DUF6631 family protein n=1 Tax=Caldimonas sp. KR1-144 TaxID=3400911 RepID=UPI003C0CB19F